MDKNKLLESLDAVMSRYEQFGLLTAEDMQSVFDQLNISRRVGKGDNVVHAIAAVHLAIIRECLKEGS